METQGFFLVEQLALRFGLASLFGLALGLDRQLRGHEAGYRTHMLVALGAAAMTVLTFEMYQILRAMAPDTNADPMRVIEGVVAAIGFLGAGVIMQQRDRQRIRNVTTAANLWLCGAIGLACGAGLYMLAGIIFAFTFIILTGLSFVERYVRRLDNDWD